MVGERDIEERLITRLRDFNKYTYREDIRDKAALEQNFRNHFQTLNRVSLTDAEFARLRDEIVTADVFKAAKSLREIGYFQREDGTPLHYTLVNLKDWCKNEFEVIHQLRINTDNSHRRYDVILLLNGLPLVQIELKTFGINPRRAMEQIVEYRNDPNSGYTNTLLCFMQLFIASNYDQTYYFANNRKEHFTFDAEERYLPIYQWAEKNNDKVTHLDDFAEALLAKCTLGRMISRYMVLVESEQKLMIMRPYQIYAVEAIVDCIQQNRGNGYIWHTTGSGKTLTSFKASTLLKDNPDIEKCLFVVDRKDLDRQTREEFNRFQEGCVEQNTNTEALVRRLLSEDYKDKVIVSTIQKLGLALDETSKKAQQYKQRGKSTFKERLAPLRDKRIAIIFDECHRSQFGESHAAIKEFFPQAQLFGFTGTPIFDQNAAYQRFDGTVAKHLTTEDIFQKQLHAYTITHAIEDNNVLRFHVDYFKAEGDPPAINQVKEPAPNPGRIATQEAIVKEILRKHKAATHQYRFNALLATASINEAIRYYNLFKQAQAEIEDPDPESRPINIACVFSPPADGNKDVKQLQEDLFQEREDNRHQPEQKKTALQQIIKDYNAQYGTNHSLAEFDLYYQDVQKRIKDQQFPNSDYPQKNKIDLTIVVDMLLTGFDSKYLNTLYIDKNLKQHGLIQAFSRTNRVLNDTKPYGNILDFRNQKQEVDNAVVLFSGVDGDESREIWLVEQAETVIKEYDSAVEDLETFMRGQGLSCTPDEVSNLKGDGARADFITHFKEVQRLKTRLDQYSSLEPEQKKQIELRMPKEQMQGFKGMYLETAQRLKAQQGKTGEAASEAQEKIDQLQFELVLFSSAVIDYDYIMHLLANFSASKPGRLTLTREELISMVGSNSNMMGDREDLKAYIETLEAGKGLDEKQIHENYQIFKAKKTKAELTGLADKHGLPHNALQGFVDNILEHMIFDGEQLSELFAPQDLGWKDRSRAELALMEELAPFLKKQSGGREISGLAAYE